MSKEKIILDYGCGWSGNYKFLSKRGVYVGVDILEKNIEYAKKVHKEGMFYVTDGNTLPFPDNYFHEVHAYDVLEHVENIDIVLNEINRVLQPNGKFFVVVPAEVSEKKLLKLKPSYFDEVGHVRIVDPKILTDTLKKKGYTCIKTVKTRGMEAVVYAFLFSLNKNHRYVEHQTGSPSFSKFLVAFIWLFDTRLFITPLKYLFFVYIFTLPVGWLISRIFPKSILMVFEKK